jgi:hypothetical protein
MMTCNAVSSRWRTLAACAASVAVAVSLVADPGASRPKVEVAVGADAVAAFEVALAADAAIESLLAEGRLEEVALEAQRVKDAIETMRASVRTTDRATSRRIQSAAKDSLVLADRLMAVAAAGNRARARTVYHNLHRYVEFVAKHLPAEITREAEPDGSGL